MFVQGKYQVRPKLPHVPGSDVSSCIANSTFMPPSKAHRLCIHIQLGRRNHNSVWSKLSQTVSCRPTSVWNRRCILWTSCLKTVAKCCLYCTRNVDYGWGSCPAYELLHILDWPGPSREDTKGWRGFDTFWSWWDWFSRFAHLVTLFHKFSSILTL